MLIITGSMGAGKTAVLAEASDILTLRKIIHAAIDLDTLGLAHLPSAASTDGVTYRNLQSICENYAALGSWFAAGQPCGLSMREDLSPITKNTSRFLPHAIVG